MNSHKYPHTIVILAMSADGKIADDKNSAARFGSKTDKIHLERQISQVDAVLFGAGTLRAYQTSLPISEPQLLQWRQKQKLSPQPVQIVVSASGNLDPTMRFFQQPIPRCLLTTSQGAKRWQKINSNNFSKILIADLKEADNNFNWLSIFEKFLDLGWKKLAILGGGKLVGSLLAENLINEFYLTLCPLILGGKNAPTPVDIHGLQPQHLELLNIKQIGQEVFLHYRISEVNAAN